MKKKKFNKTKNGTIKKLNNIMQKTTIKQMIEV